VPGFATPYAPYPGLIARRIRSASSVPGVAVGASIGENGLAEVKLQMRIL